MAIVITVVSVIVNGIAHWFVCIGHCVFVIVYASVSVWVLLVCVLVLLVLLFLC